MRRLPSLLLVVGTTIGLACTAGDSHRIADTTAQPPVIAAHQTLILDDTQTVLSPGLPSDADDTASTRYDKHYTPRRLASPDCRPQGIALCLRDTATRVYSVNCCMNDQRQTDWLVFATARDSLQLFLKSAFDAYLTISPRNAAGAVAESSLGVDASWLRSRFAVAGSYIFTAGIEADSPAVYELRVASVIATGASQPTGFAARLVVNGSKKAAIAVAPRSMMPENDIAALRRFAVKPGAYHVLLVRDTLYSACVLPCAHRVAFTLKPGQDVTIAPPAQ